MRGRPRYKDRAQVRERITIRLPGRLLAWLKRQGNASRTVEAALEKYKDEKEGAKGNASGRKARKARQKEALERVTTLLAIIANNYFSLEDEEWNLLLQFKEKLEKHIWEKYGI